MSTTTWAQTSQGARDLDRAAAEEAGARVAREQALTREVEALADLRVGEARAEAASRAQEREAGRRQAQAQRVHARQEEKAARRAQQRARRRAGWQQRRALVAVVPMMAVSAGVALPAQYDYYLQFTGHGAGAKASAAAMAFMVEGGTWLGAALESAALERRQPTGVYRMLTWTLAGVAAAVNAGHGARQGWQVATVFALASLMGVTSWSAYMRLRTHQDSDRPAEQLRLATWRRLRYPRLSWRSASLRAAIGAQLSVDDAWMQVWEDHHAAPLRSGPVPAPHLVEVDPGEHDPVETVPVEVGVRVEVDPAPVEVLDLVELVASLPVESPVELAGEPLALEPGAPGLVRAVASMAPVAPVWIQPPPLDPGAAVEVDPATDEETEDLLDRLEQAIRAGRLPLEPSAEAVRKELEIAWRTAKALLDERDERAQEEPAGYVDRAPVEVDPSESTGQGRALVGAR